MRLLFDKKESEVVVKSSFDGNRVGTLKPHSVSGIWCLAELDLSSMDLPTYHNLQQEINSLNGGGK